MSTGFLRNKQITLRCVEFLLRVMRRGFLLRDSSSLRRSSSYSYMGLIELLLRKRVTFKGDAQGYLTGSHIGLLLGEIIYAKFRKYIGLSLRYRCRSDVCSGKYVSFKIVRIGSYDCCLYISRCVSGEW